MKALIGKIEIRIYVDSADPTKCLNCPYLLPYPIHGNPTAGFIPGVDGLTMQCILFGGILGRITADQYLVPRSDKCLNTFGIENKENQ